MNISRVLWVVALLPLLMAAIAGCGSEAAPNTEQGTEVPTATPLAVPAGETLAAAPPAATATPTATAGPTLTTAPTATTPSATSTPRPKGGPSAPLPTEVPLLGSVQIPLDHPSAPLAVLPVNSLIYTHIEMESVASRPDLQEHVEFQLAHFVSEDQLPLAKEVLAGSAVRTLTLSRPHERYEWACILRGDMALIASALLSASDSGDGLSVSVIETFAGTDIYALVRTRSSGRQSEIYMAVLDEETLAASPDYPALFDIVARSREPLQLPHALSLLVQEWGTGDFLQVLNIAFFGLGATAQGTPLDRQRLFTFQATLAEDSTTVVRAIQQYDDEVHANEAANWLAQQDEPRWRNIGWGSSAMVDLWRQKGATVYGEVTVPDADVPGLVQGN